MSFEVSNSEQSENINRVEVLLSEILTEGSDVLERYRNLDVMLVLSQLGLSLESLSDEEKISAQVFQEIVNDGENASFSLLCRRTQMITSLFRSIWGKRGDQSFPSSPSGVGTNNPSGGEVDEIAEESKSCAEGTQNGKKVSFKEEIEEITQESSTSKTNSLMIENIEGQKYEVFQLLKEIFQIEDFPIKQQDYKDIPFDRTQISSICYFFKITKYEFFDLWKKYDASDRGFKFLALISKKGLKEEIYVKAQQIQ